MLSGKYQRDSSTCRPHTHMYTDNWLGKLLHVSLECETRTTISVIEEDGLDKGSLRAKPMDSQDSTMTLANHIYFIHFHCNLD